MQRCSTCCCEDITTTQHNLQSVIQHIAASCKRIGRALRRCSEICSWIIWWRCLLGVWYWAYRLPLSRRCCATSSLQMCRPLLLDVAGLAGVVVARWSRSTKLRPARLVLGWVTSPGFNSRCRKPISVYITSDPCQLSLATLRGQTQWVYQPKGGDALRLGNKGRYGSFVGGR